MKLTISPVVAFGKGLKARAEPSLPKNSKFAEIQTSLTVVCQSKSIHSLYAHFKIPHKGLSKKLRKSIKGKKRDDWRRKQEQSEKKMRKKERRKVDRDRQVRERAGADGKDGRSSWKRG